MSGRNITAWTATPNNIAAVHTHAIRIYENAEAVWSKVLIRFTEEGLAALDAALLEANAVLAELKQASRPASSEEAAIHIGYMITAFDNFSDMTIRIDRMLDFVLRAEPAIGDLIQACVNLTVTRDKTPSIHQIMEAIAAAKEEREDLVALYVYAVEARPDIAAIVAAKCDAERDEAYAQRNEKPHYQQFEKARNRRNHRWEEKRARLAITERTK